MTHDSAKGAAIRQAENQFFATAIEIVYMLRAICI
jgi:hypothetical protein